MEEGDLHTVKEWTAVLSFATQFNLKSVRALAIKKLTPLASAVEKIFEGTLYGVNEWILPSLVELCTRDEFLTLEESFMLGVRDLHLVASVRELRNKPALLVPTVEVIVEEMLKERMGGHEENMGQSGVEANISTPNGEDEYWSGDPKGSDGGGFTTAVNRRRSLPPEPASVTPSSPPTPPQGLHNGQAPATPVGSAPSPSEPVFIRPAAGRNRSHLLHVLKQRTHPVPNETLATPLNLTSSSQPTPSSTLGVSESTSANISLDPSALSASSPRENESPTNTQRDLTTVPSLIVAPTLPPRQFHSATFLTRPFVVPSTPSKVPTQSLWAALPFHDPGESEGGRSRSMSARKGIKKGGKK